MDLNCNTRVNEGGIYQETWRRHTAIGVANSSNRVFGSWQNQEECLILLYRKQELSTMESLKDNLCDKVSHFLCSPAGCCKPPTQCGYTYMNETVWSQGGGIVGGDPDCVRWSNDQQQLCYYCNSCKAGALASLKKSWRRVSVINIVILIILVIYIVSIAAFRHNKPIDNDEPYGETRMEKAQPSRIHF